MPVPKLSIIHDSQRARWFWSLIILLVFALFRLPDLGVPLAGDELATVSLWAQMPYLKIIANYQYPNNHIFLSLVLSFLLKTFGLREWLLRVPLLVCGTVSIYLGYRLGKRIAGKAVVGLFTAFLMAICEKHIYYSTNARGYIVLMMLALLSVACVLDRLDGRSFKIQKFSTRFNEGLAFLGWVVIWLVGTWTVPTFFFFEVSIAIFMAGLMLAENRPPALQTTLMAIPLASCLVGGIGFYLQYYVLIDSVMLAEATSRAATISLPLFFPELMIEWLKPFEQAGVLFLLFALLGFMKLFQQNRRTSLLMACVLLGPALMGVVGFLLEKLPGVPHPRTFFYLQPFFLMLGVMGGREAGERFLTWIKKYSVINSKGPLAITGVLALVFFLIASANFFRHMYPQRLSRQPLHKVHDFVKKLSPYDLVLVSHAMHVEFYLYGARDMRQRIENILHDGKLGNLYFLDYQKENVSLNQEPEKNRFLNFPVLTEGAGKEGPFLPEKALQRAAQFGSFVFYRLKEGWLKPLPGWEKLGLSQTSLQPELYRWEKVPGPLGNRPLLRFENSFTVATGSNEPWSSKTPVLTLNLAEVAGSERNFSAVLVGGKIQEGSIILDPSWLVNAWMLDHPYGSNIFNHSWNPTVFISQGEGSLSVIDVKYYRHPGKGAFRNFLSYRINEPGVEKE